MTDVQKIKLQRWWMGEIQQITRKVMEKEEKRQKKEKTKAAEMLADFSSRDDINEAYGYGMISEKWRDKLLDLWDKSNEGHGELYDEKIQLLQDAYAEAQAIMSELGQEV